MDVEIAEDQALRGEYETPQAPNIACSDGREIGTSRLRKELEATTLDREKGRVFAR